MSRFNITQDQIKLLTFDQLESLRLEICDETAELGRMEYMIYKQRRELELLAHPELASELEQESKQQVNTTTSSMQVQKLIQAALKKGLDIQTIMKELEK